MVFLQRLMITVSNVRMNWENNAQTIDISRLTNSFECDKVFSIKHILTALLYLRGDIK